MRLKNDEVISAPSSPDWGWRIELEVTELDEFEMRMYNISPQGEEELAVQARYDRSIEADE